MIVFWHGHWYNCHVKNDYHSFSITDLWYTVYKYRITSVDLLECHKQLCPRVGNIHHLLTWYTSVVHTTEMVIIDKLRQICELCNASSHHHRKASSGQYMPPMRCTVVGTWEEIWCPQSVAMLNSLRRCLVFRNTVTCGSLCAYFTWKLESDWIKSELAWA